MTILAPRVATELRIEVAAAAGVGVLAALLAAGAAIWPMQILLATFVVGATLSCLINVELAVLVLVAFVPLELAISWGANGQLSPTKIAGLLCFSSFALFAIVSGRRLVFDRVHAVAALLLVISLLSTLGARDQSLAIQTTTRYASFVALCFVVSQFVGGHRLQTRIAWVLSIGSAITGMLALNSFFSGQSSAARLPFGDPGDIGFILATTLPFTLWLLREQGFRRVVAGALIGVILVSTALTLSRGTLIGLGAGLAWMLLGERRNVRVLLVGGLMGLIGFAAVAHFEGNRIEAGLQAKEFVAKANVDTRLEAWRAAGRFAVENPILGIGPGNFRVRYPEVLDQPPGTKTLAVVHNSFLDVAAELGIVAMVLFLAYLALVFHRLAVAVRDDRGPPGYAVAARTSLVIAVVAGFTLTEQYYAPFWLIGGLAVALARDTAPPTAP